MNEKYPLVNTWFCDLECKLGRAFVGPFSDQDPNFREIMSRHEKAGCKGFQQGKPPQTLAYGVRYKVETNDLDMFCTIHCVRAENQQTYTAHDIKDECKWEPYVEKIHFKDLYKAEARKEIHKIEKINSLTDIEDPKYSGHDIIVNATLASNSISYTIPSKIKISCYSDNEKHACERSNELELEGSNLVQCIDVSDYVKENQLVKMGKKEKGFTPDCKISVKTLETTTLKRMRVRPVVSSLEKNDGKFFDGDGNEWKSYDAYFRQDQIQKLDPGTEIQLEGKVIPDPKNQKITILIQKYKSAETKHYDLSNLNSLKEFCNDKEPSEIINYYCKEFEKYSKIIGRGDITTCGLLTFGSLTHIDQVPAWLKCLIIGDSTTGKSETIRKLMILLKCGQMVSGETASTVGLAGAATQSSNNSWFIDWGPLVLQDKKLLAIDGAHQLGREHWAQLAESERNGKIQIMKAGKGEALARTRQIKIMNPKGDDFRTPRTMKSFFYPAQSIVNNLQVQSIARQDLVIFVSDDVTTEQRNIRNGHTHDKKLEYISDLIHMIWEQNFKVVFNEDAIDEILAASIRLERRFKHEEIPLITNDQKDKMRKLSASLAALTLSFNEDFSTLTVKKEHIQYMEQLIATNYHNAGLDIISKNDSDDLDDEEITEIIFKIKQSLSKKEPQVDDQFCKNILLWCVEKTSFMKDQLQSAFELARDNEVKPLIAVLRNESLLNQKHGFTPSSKLIKLAKILQKQQPQTENKEEGVSPLHQAKETKEAKTIPDEIITHTQETIITDSNNSNESLASLARLEPQKGDTPPSDIPQLPINSDEITSFNSENTTTNSDEKLQNRHESEQNESNEQNNLKTVSSNISQSYRCINCNSHWPNTNTPIEELQTQHSMGNENHTITKIDI